MRCDDLQLGDVSIGSDVVVHFPTETFGLFACIDFNVTKKSVNII